MKTWQLWQTLTPPPHPLVKRLVTDQARMDWSRLGVWVLLLSMGPLAAVVDDPARFAIGVVLVAVLYLTSNAFFQGIAWAMRAAAVIAQESRRGTRDLLYALPPGALHVNWMVFVGELHRNRVLAAARREMRWIARGGTGLVAIVLAGGAWFGSASSMRWAGEIGLATGLILAAGLVNYVQTVISSGIIGLLVANISSDTGLTLLIALLIWHLGSYALALAVMSLASALLPALTSLASALLGAAATLALREIAIARLWRRLAWQLNADAAWGAET